MTEIFGTDRDPYSGTPSDSKLDGAPVPWPATTLLAVIYNRRGAALWRWLTLCSARPHMALKTSRSARRKAVWGPKRGDALRSGIVHLLLRVPRAIFNEIADLLDLPPALRPAAEIAHRSEHRGYW